MVASFGLAGISDGQLLDTRFKGDLTLAYVNAAKSAPDGRFYTPLGRYSTFGIRSSFAAGFTAYISQRLQRIPGDVDNELFDEYYVEDEGFWRVGKQYMPFGGGTLLHESVRAARGDNNLIIEGVKLALAVVDSGPGRQSGFVGRMGGKSLGFSFAVGRHFGINGTALPTVRNLENSPGLGGGWRQAYGLDINRKFGKLVFKVDAVALRDPETALESEIQIGDLFVSYDLEKKLQLAAGASQVSGEDVTHWRMMATYAVAKGLSVETMLRQNSDRFVDFSVMVRAKF